MITDLLNPWIRDLVPYSSARSEFSGNADAFKDNDPSMFQFNIGMAHYF